MNQRKKVLLLAPGCDGTDVGESWSCFQWVKGLAESCDVTLLTLRRPGRKPASEQLDNVEVVEWNDLPLSGRWERLASMLKPGYARFYRQSRRWIRHQLAIGRSFDLAHQLGPLALRYPCPAIGLGLPVIMGPLAGSLQTPPGFQAECRGAAWYTRLRGLDRLRLRLDPLLRRTFREATVVIGVAPYVREILGGLKLQRFELAAETGVYQTQTKDWSTPRAEGSLKLLYVGRVVRTKGLRDVVRALSLLKDLPGITLDAVGGGEDLVPCQNLARELGVSHQIHFHGRIDRSAVEALYRQSDLFVFPSFREPSGNVIFEALSHGLPVITTDRGGPGFVVQPGCGLRIPAENPAQLAAAVAQGIRELAGDRDRLRTLSRGATTRAEEYALWPNKIESLLALYDDIAVPREELQPAVQSEVLV